MKPVLVVFGILVVVALLIVLVGWSLPVRHRVSRQATFAASPDAVYAVIADVEQFPAWRSKVTRVEIVASATGARSFREFGDDGAILYVVDEAVPGRRLVTRIADDSLPFGGTWTFELAPVANAANGTTLRITEDGAVYNPVFRFVSKFIISQHATIDGYLADLGRKFGTIVVISP